MLEENKLHGPRLTPQTDIFSEEDLEGCGHPWSPAWSGWGQKGHSVRAAWDPGGQLAGPGGERRGCPSLSGFDSSIQQHNPGAQGQAVGVRSPLVQHKLNGSLGAASSESLAFEGIKLSN